MAGGFAEWEFQRLQKECAACLGLQTTTESTTLEALERGLMDTPFQAFLEFLREGGEEQLSAYTIEGDRFELTEALRDWQSELQMRPTSLPHSRANPGYSALACDQRLTPSRLQASCEAQVG